MLVLFTMLVIKKWSDVWGYVCKLMEVVVVGGK
jgi:hypothetical protein